MSETVASLKRASRSLVWSIRALLCEGLVCAAMKIAPEHYVSSVVEVAAEMYRRGKSVAMKELK